MAEPDGAAHAPHFQIEPQALEERPPVVTRAAVQDVVRCPPATLRSKTRPVEQTRVRGNQVQNASDCPIVHWGRQTLREFTPVQFVGARVLRTVFREAWMRHESLCVQNLALPEVCEPQPLVLVAPETIARMDVQMTKPAVVHAANGKQKLARNGVVRLAKGACLNGSVQRDLRHELGDDRVERTAGESAKESGEKQPRLVDCALARIKNVRLVTHLLPHAFAREVLVSPHVFDGNVVTEQGVLGNVNQAKATGAYLTKGLVATEKQIAALRNF